MQSIDENKIIETIKAEENDFYSDDDIYNITSWGSDLSIRELIERYKEGTMLKPEMQRNYVWDKAEASRFIDSILLGLPIPSIFLAKAANEKLLIVDGYQRIMTVYDYTRGIFTPDDKVFKLTNSVIINPRWRGKAFSELKETEQLKIRNTTIHSIIFVQLKPSGDDTSMFQVFERINTSGRTLFPQEIRNCVYHGKFNNELMLVNNDPIWRKLYGLPKPDSRMRDVEFILRFMTLENIKYKNINKTSISLKKEMNLFMGNEKSKRDDILAERVATFKKCLYYLNDKNNINPFHNISKTNINKYVEKFHPTIFDSTMLATEYMFRKHRTKIEGLSDLSEKRLEMLRDNQYQDAIRIRTTNIDQIVKRISLATQYLYGAEYEEC